MSRFLFDTDHITLLSQNHARVVDNVVRHAADDLFASVITIEEQLLGWLTALNKTRDRARKEVIYYRMAQAVSQFAQFSILSFTIGAMDIHDDLVRKRLNIGAKDTKIAAIALHFGAAVVTKNSRDFSRVPGLNVVDWSI